MSTEVEVTARGAIVRYRGPVTLEGIRQAAEAMAGDAAFSPDLPAVWDFTASERNRLEADDMRKLAHFVSPMREGGGRPRVAVVTPDDANFGGARMFGGLNEPRLLVELSVFRCPVEAERWAFGAAEDDTARVPDGPSSG